MKPLHSILISFFVSALFLSCFKNNLQQPAQGLLTQSELANKQGVEELLIGAYSMLDGFANVGPSASSEPPLASAGSNWIYGSICGSEAYKGGSLGDLDEITQIGDFMSNSSTDFLDGKWVAVYEGVQRANSVIRVMRQASSLSPADTLEIAAEARFLRGFYHFEAKKMWNNIPYVDENVTYDAGNYHVPNDTSWAPIENDLLFAMKNLPSSQGAAGLGRANSYAAEAYLAKAYMFEHKYAQALPLLQDLITNGETSGGLKYALNSLYSDNFNPNTKNSSESVFACQSSVNDGAEGDNGNAGDLLNYPDAPNSCCDFFQPSEYLVNHFKTDSITGLPDLYNFNDIPIANDEKIASDSPFIPYAGTLDPRLDWTVGRRGIPYLDWGIHPGYDWTSPQDFGPYSPKKESYPMAQSAMYSQSGFSLETAVNINLMRFADVLLWAAEAEIAAGSLDQAEDYVNMIRNRAANPQGFVHTYIDASNPQGGFTQIPAANYFIKPYPSGYFATQGPAFALKAIQFERMLELGMEGHRFFDLVRWGIAATEINDYFAREEKLVIALKGATFTANTNNYFPIPDVEIQKSAGPNGIPAMKQNPGY